MPQVSQINIGSDFTFNTDFNKHLVNNGIVSISTSNTVNAELGYVKGQVLRVNHVWDLLLFVQLSWKTEFRL